MKDWIVGVIPITVNILFLRYKFRKVNGHLRLDFLAQNLEPHI